METNKNIKDMLKSILDNDKDAFKANFGSEIDDRISSKIADIHYSISKDILKTSRSENEDWIYKKYK